MNLKKWYDNVKDRAFVVFPDGQILPTLTGLQSWGCPSIVSGSFNPLHQAHKALYYSASGAQKAFELSVCRHGKPDLTYNELATRLAQFAWYAPVIVTAAWRYKDKAKAMFLPYAVFHIGYDTAVCLLETETRKWLNETSLTFVVHSREVTGKICTFHDLPYIPDSFCEGKSATGMESISSTKIRNSEK